jgi:hypothetical protein
VHGNAEAHVSSWIGKMSRSEWWSTLGVLVQVNQNQPGRESRRVVVGTQFLQKVWLTSLAVHGVNRHPEVVSDAAYRGFVNVAFHSGGERNDSVAQHIYSPNSVS